MILSKNLLWGERGRMVKNIVLIDSAANYLDAVLSMNYVKIKALIVDKSHLKICREKYYSKIENIYLKSTSTNKEFEFAHNTDYNITYMDIEKYRHTQLKCEHYLHRELLDNTIIQYRYYMCLRFWLGFFAKNQIHIVVTTHIEHGALWDTIIIDIAKSNNIPVYGINVYSTSSVYDINYILNLNDRTFVDIGKLQLSTIKLDSYFKQLQEMKIMYTNKCRIDLFKKLNYNRY